MNQTSTIPPSPFQRLNALAANPPAPSAAYIHVPFCVHRCGYCDFTVIAGRDDLVGPFLEALENEVRGALSEPVPVRTIFIGGGTPTYLPPQDLRRLLEMVRRWLPLAQGGEFSIEANPAGFDSERMAALAEFGVNRVSLGVQSFHANHLRTLERDHSPGDVADVVSRLRKQGLDNISLDLIYAVPGQDLADWEATLQKAIALSPQHISTYGLTFEKGTSFWVRRSKGELPPPPDELERSMYAQATTLLPAAGFHQYELSNFARPGYECRHNRVYWRAEPYFGFGPGAASYLEAVRESPSPSRERAGVRVHPQDIVPPKSFPDSLLEGVRRTNHRSVTTWLKRIQSGQSPVGEEERISTDLLAREAVMLGLRQTSGIGLKEFHGRFGTSVESLAPQPYHRFREQGLLAEENGRVALTLEGRFLADTVIAEFL